MCFCGFRQSHYLSWNKSYRGKRVTFSALKRYLCSFYFRIDNETGGIHRNTLYMERGKRMDFASLSAFFFPHGFNQFSAAVLNRLISCKNGSSYSRAVLLLLVLLYYYADIPGRELGVWLGQPDQYLVQANYTTKFKSIHLLSWMKEERSGLPNSVFARAGSTANRVSKFEYISGQYYKLALVKLTVCIYERNYQVNIC